MWSVAIFEEKSKKGYDFKQLEALCLFEGLKSGGTDELGRDVLIRLVYGSRVSMSVAFWVTLFSALIGLLIGVFAGLSKGFLDSLLMRFTDAFLSIPQLPFLIFVSAIDLSKLPFFSGLDQNESVFKMIFILCLFSWMTVARMSEARFLP